MGFISHKAEQTLKNMELQAGEEEKDEKHHCVKSDRIRSYSGPNYPACGLNTDQNNSEYGHFSRSAYRKIS